jgi:hypothetical protein
MRVGAGEEDWRNQQAGEKAASRSWNACPHGRCYEENQENWIIKAKHFKQTKAVFHEPRKPQNAWASNERFFSPPILPFELLL